MEINLHKAHYLSEKENYRMKIKSTTKLKLKLTASLSSLMAVKETQSQELQVSLKQ